jgi:hypothetical protein
MKRDLRTVGRALAAGMLALSTAACATVTRGTTEVWAVTTDPGGATVKTSNGYGCPGTPCTFKIEHKAEFDVDITMPGYRTYHGHVTHQVAAAGAGGFVGNALVGGIIGGGIDVASGATLELKPNPLVVKLEPVPPPAAVP